MKKILLAIILLVLIVVVSYIKTTREYERSKSYYEDGRVDAARDLDAYQRESDSLRKASAQQQLAFADSLVQKDLKYQAQVDSLEDVVDKMESEISGLSDQQASTGSAGAAVTETKSAPSKHEEILSYYKRRFSNLPKDLSDYEKRIAIDEIREETSLKFSISLDELKKIREEHKLTY